MAYSVVRWLGAAVLVMVLSPAVARADTRSSDAVRRELDIINRQLLAEAVMAEALQAFPTITLQEFQALPDEALRRHAFVNAWTAYYREAALGQSEIITSIPEVTDPEARRRLEALQPTGLQQGMGTDGATRVVAPGLPPVLRQCAERHEARHEEDIHAMARYFARRRARATLASGALDEHPEFARLRVERGADVALELFADALYRADVEANREFVAEQRVQNGAGPVMMVDGPLRDANVYYGHVDAEVPPAENFERVKRLAAYELRAYAVSSECLLEQRAALTAELESLQEDHEEVAHDASDANP